MTAPSSADPRAGLGAPIIQVRDLCKRYGSLTAVDGVSFEVAEGEVFGILGPERRRKDDHARDDRGHAADRRGHRGHRRG